MSQETKNASELAREKTNISAKKLELNVSSPSKFSAAREGDSPGTGAKAVYKTQQWLEVEDGKRQIDDQIAQLDDRLNLVLAKQEYEYLKSYNIFVKRKEFELRQLITKLNQKNSDNTAKDAKINNLEKTIQSIRDDQIRMEKEKDEQAKEIKKQKSKSDNLQQERDFLHQQVLEAKRQNKLLKLAIGRLQTQIDKQPPALPSAERDKLKLLMEDDGHKQGETFLTESKQPIVNVADETHQDIGEHSQARGAHTDMKKVQNTSQAQESKEMMDTAAHTSYLGANQSYLTSGTAAAIQFAGSVMQSKGTARAQTRSPTSRYRLIPTENLKFQKFIDLIYSSKMTPDEQKEEIVKYVSLLETNYNQTIRDLKTAVHKERMKAKRSSFEKVNEVSQKNELESLFVECIEEIRKGIMKRRLKNEIMNKKKYQQIEKNTEEAREFEQSLLKLAELAKNRVKIQDFTNKDKNHLLELFVNNEKTLLKIYEILFPHRAGPNAGQGVSTTMVAESGNGIYGQNAIRTLSRGNPNLQNESSILNRSMQAQNAHLLTNIQQPYNDYDYGKLKQGPGINNFLPSTGARNDIASEHLPNIMGAQKQQLNLQLSNSKSNLNTMGYAQIEGGTNVSRTMTAENYMRPKNARNTGIPEVPPGQPGQPASYSGVQASHLGVYPHGQGEANGKQGGAYQQ